MLWPVDLPLAPVLRSIDSAGTLIPLFADFTAVGSEEVPRGAGLRPPLKRLVRFSRKPLSQRCLIEGSRKEPARSICPPVSGPSSLPPDWASERVSSGHDVRVFHSTNLSASWTLLTPSPSRTDHLCQPTSPAHPAAARAVTRLSPGLKYYSVVRLLAAHPFPLRLSTYRVGYPGATRKHDEPSWGHVQIFRTVPLANTLVRRVGKNAFAAIVPARPCPVFGRPIRHGVAPSTTARYFSASPSDSTSRWTPCPPVVSRQ